MTIWEILRELRLAVESGLLTRDEARSVLATHGGPQQLGSAVTPGIVPAMSASAGAALTIGAPVPTNGTQTLPTGETIPLDASGIEGARAGSKPATPADVAQWAASRGIKETGQVPPARG